MRAFYEAWWAELAPTFAQTTEIYLGHPEHPVVSLTAHDWIQEALPPWRQQHIRAAYGLAPAPINKAGAKRADAVSNTAGPVVHSGHWGVKVVRSGNYDISLRRWPVEANQPITASLPAGTDVPGSAKAYRAYPGVAVPAVSASLRIDGQNRGTKPVSTTDTHVTFTTALTASSHQLAAVFTTAAGDELGAYYVVVTAVATIK